MASRQRESLRGRRESPKEDEQTKRRVKRSAAGCLTFLTFMIAIALFPLYSPLFCEDPSVMDGIGDNLSAVQIVEIGMTEREVLERMNKPTPPWTVLYLDKWDGDGWNVGVPSGGMSEIRLSSEGASLENSPYYAYIFFPEKDRDSDPTFVYFDRDGEAVIHVGRLSCEETLQALEAGNHTGVPDGSACWREPG